MDSKVPKKRFCLVYRTTNLTNGKYYIGCHCTFKLDDGYLGSGMRIQRAIAKYGRENFKLQILQFFETREEALAREKELVTEELLKDPMCMNLKPGGNGGWSHDQLVQLALRARKRLAQLYELDPDRRIRMGESTRKLFREGKMTKFTWKGRKHSDQTKSKMSLAASQRIGARNSQFGTCWIMKEGHSIRIKRKELTKYLLNGWNLGRTYRHGPVAQDASLIRRRPQFDSG